MAVWQWSEVPVCLSVAPPLSYNASPAIRFTTPHTATPLSTTRPPYCLQLSEIHGKHTTPCTNSTSLDFTYHASNVKGFCSHIASLLPPTLPIIPLDHSHNTPPVVWLCCIPVCRPGRRVPQYTKTRKLSNPITA